MQERPVSHQLLPMDLGPGFNEPLLSARRPHPAIYRRCQSMRTAHWRHRSRETKRPVPTRPEMRPAS